MISENIIKFPNLKDTIQRFQDLRSFESQTSSLTIFDIIPQDDFDRKLVKQILETGEFSSLIENKAFACIIGAAIGDALGAHLEGQPIDYKRKIITDFPSLKEVVHNMARPPIGLFTDDTSQALCLADSIIENNFQFDGIDLRHRIMQWWFNGYNNCKGKDPKSQLSFGLGISTMNSFIAFIKKQTEFVNPAFVYDAEINANGSIMRLAPVPVAFQDDIVKGMEFAVKQSKASHNGEEASELCRLLTFLAINFLHISDPTEGKLIYMDNLKNHIQSQNPAVQAMIESSREHDFYLYKMSKYNRNLDDRVWDWKKINYKYSPFRASKSPNFIGTYAMDAACMAFHIVYHTNSFEEAIVKAVNLGGDSDSVASITGMLAGALYGYNEFIKKNYEYIRYWDEDRLAIRAFKLINKKLNSV